MTGYATVRTVLGIVGLLQSPRGLAAVTLPQESKEAAVLHLRKSASRAHSMLVEAPAEDFGMLCEMMRQYALGIPQSFEVTLDTNGWTDFQVRVWRATQEIPYGETRSYSWVARTACNPRACRATGQALHHNPFPIVVPCHRVIGADGKLTGFGGGLEMKRRLLSLEGFNNGL
ncbi:MAG: methylated-DNA--[protein]-cysteine S-methyltransferase [Chloroflexota bacterium]